MHSFGGTTLTADELAQFGEEYVAFLSRWTRDPDQRPLAAGTSPSCSTHSPPRTAGTPRDRPGHTGDH